jgi:very-short-patch-repair endonuclease
MKIKIKDLEYLGSRIIRQADEDTFNKKKYIRKLPFAKSLNDQYFKSERWFDEFLEEKGFKERPLSRKNPYRDRSFFGYRRNLPVGIYYVDFAFPAYRIAIEIDGKSHGDKLRKVKDTCKDHYLGLRGWKVFRIEDGDVVKANHVMQRLSDARSQVIIWLNLTYPQQPLESQLIYFSQHPKRISLVQRYLGVGETNPPPDVMEKLTQVENFNPDNKIPSGWNPKTNVQGPSKKDVMHLCKKTGESPHKAYFWLLTEMNQDL